MIRVFLSGWFEASTQTLLHKERPFYIACQTAARERWIAARQRELLPTRYWHVVFTLPSRLAPVVLQNKKVLYDLLFRSSAQTLLEVSHTNTRRLSAGLDFIACPTASYMSS